MLRLEEMIRASEPESLGKPKGPCANAIGLSSDGHAIDANHPLVLVRFTCKVHSKSKGCSAGLRDCDWRVPKFAAKTTVPKRHVGKERAQTDASMTFAQVADG